MHFAPDGAVEQRVRVVVGAFAAARVRVQLDRLVHAHVGRQHRLVYEQFYFGRAAAAAC